jgi:hypothetical protein
LNNPNDNGLLTPIMEANIKRFADNLYAGPIKVKYYLFDSYPQRILLILV